MLKEKHGDIISTTNGLGMSCGIGIVKTNADGTKEPDLDGTFKILYRAYEKGLLVISVAGNILRIQPPLNIDHDLFRKAWMKLWLIMKQAISLTTYCSSRMAGNIDITREKQFMLLSFCSYKTSESFHIRFSILCFLLCSLPNSSLKAPK